MHVNLLQQVDGKGVDLREKAHQEGDWEAVGKTCLMRKTKDIFMYLSKKKNTVSILQATASACFLLLYLSLPTRRSRKKRSTS